MKCKESPPLAKWLKVALGEIIKTAYVAEGVHRIEDFESEINQNSDDLDFSFETIIIEFVNGKHLLIGNSEWAWLNRNIEISKSYSLEIKRKEIF